MPLPLILLGAAAITAAYGVKKGVDAYFDAREASGLREDTSDLLSRAQGDLRKERSRCAGTLEELGRLKFETWDVDLGRFCSLFERLRNVELAGAPGVGEVTWSDEELREMRELSGYASEVVSGGLAAVGSGALVGMATYGGATMFATASTGTAISTLSGVAATNATLAWFGGGALSAGGLGMAGGMAVLGGIVAGPVLAVGGSVWAAKAREDLAEAERDHALAKKHAREMQGAQAVVRGIRKVANQYIEIISEIVARVRLELDCLASAIGNHGTDFARYPDDAKRDVYRAVQFAQCLKALLEAPILQADGRLDERHPEALERGRSLLGNPASA